MRVYLKIIYYPKSKKTRRVGYSAPKQLNIKINNLEMDFQFNNPFQLINYIF